MATWHQDGDFDDDDGLIMVMVKVMIGTDQPDRNEM